MTDHGNFVWYELMTDDADKARAFYKVVVGWDIGDASDMPGMDYRMIMRGDGGMAGGMMVLDEGTKANAPPPCWVCYIHHPDVDAAVRTITDAGGTLHMGPQDMEGVGRMAMVADPQGAIFYVMNPTPPADNPDATSDVFDYEKPQHIRWNELWTTDQDAAAALYTSLFGWEQEGAMEMGPMGEYRFIQGKGGAIGAIAPAQEGGEGSRWQFFAGVDDIDRACKAVTESGGKLLGDPQQIPGGEYSAYAHDPSGATIGLVGPRKE